MAKNVKSKPLSRSETLTRKEIEADFNRHSQKVPHSQAAMSRTYDQMKMTTPSTKERTNEKYQLKKRSQKIRIETDSALRNYAKKDSFMAARIREEDTMRNLYENKIRKEAWRDKIGIFVSIAFSAPFFLRLGKGQLSITTDFLFALGLAGIILFGPPRKYDTAIKGVVLLFLTFFVIFGSYYWETAYQIANDGRMKPDSFLHLLTVTPLKYILISTIVAGVFIFYEKISSSYSSFYHEKR